MKFVTCYASASGLLLCATLFTPVIQVLDLKSTLLNNLRNPFGKKTLIASNIDFGLLERRKSEFYYYGSLFVHPVQLRPDRVAEQAAQL